MSDFAEIVNAKDDEELLIMVYKIEEWSSEMLEAIEAKLAKRGILPNDINSHKQQLIEMEDAALSVGRKASLPGHIYWISLQLF